MTTLRDNRSAHRTEPAKAIFQHRALILRYGAVQQTAQIAAARDLALFVSHHVTAETKVRSVFAPPGVNAQTNAPQFTITVAQNTIRKDCFLDLWRNFC